MSSESIAPDINNYLTKHLSTYLEELHQLCAVECPTHHKPGVDEAGVWVHQWATRRGWEIQTWPDSTVGDSLAVSIPGGNDHAPQLLIAAHLDTVYPVGTAAERPLHYEGDHLIGPGTADNKSGLLSGLYAMAALEELGRLDTFGRICLVCGSDEEAGMHASTAVLRELAPDYDMALVVEPGRENGDIVSARKGGGRFNLEVFGKAAHAGVEPHKGANAILALAQQISALHLLNGMRPGTTLNVGVVQGGTTRNAVPDYAYAEIDVRVLHPDDMEPVTNAIEQIAQTTYVAGTTAKLDG
ncbi:MAG: M20/M25/M40 family metallo-hydrolase, partial [Chloroflexota bacterium]